ncbi:MAG: hypothetical protein KC466_10015 [Myxococcales bacterium]|nr:hypothetical protein [Myxococcales bacterium]
MSTFAIPRKDANHYESALIDVQREVAAIRSIADAVEGLERHDWDGLSAEDPAKFLTAMVHAADCVAERAARIIEEALE